MVVYAEMHSCMHVAGVCTRRVCISAEMLGCMNVAGVSTCKVCTSAEESRRSTFTRALTYSPSVASLLMPRPPSNCLITASASPCWFSCLR